MQRLCSHEMSNTSGFISVHPKKAQLCLRILCHVSAHSLSIPYSDNSKGSPSYARKVHKPLLQVVSLRVIIATWTCHPLIVLNISCEISCNDRRLPEISINPSISRLCNCGPRPLQQYRRKSQIEEVLAGLRALSAAAEPQVWAVVPSVRLVHPSSHKGETSSKPTTFRSLQSASGSCCRSYLSIPHLPQKNSSITDHGRRSRRGVLQ